MSHVKIQSTSNYRLFERSSDNRPLHVEKHGALKKSMKEYGFLECFPIVVTRDAGNKLTVKDGQHRLAIAESLGLKVYWIEAKTDFDVAKVNDAQKVWVMRDYAEKFAANGKAAYADGLRFADDHKLAIGTAFALLAGMTNFSNVRETFGDGTFKIKDRDWAEAVAGIYAPLILMSPEIKNSRLVEACMAVCRVNGFDGMRLLGGAKRCREKLVPYSTRDAYLDMLEEIYNFGRQNLFDLKNKALMAMRDRNAAEQKRRAKAAKTAA